MTITKSVAAMAAVLLCLPVLGCAGESKTRYTGPGACVSISEDDAVEYVDCDSEQAERILVYSTYEGAPDCMEDLRQLAIQQYLNGKPVGMGSYWCTGEPGALTAGQQALLDQALERAKESQG